MAGFLTCESTCDTLYADAFASHPTCYIQGGFCGLSVWDKAMVVWTVGTDLVSGPAFSQALQTATGCGQQMIDDIESEIESLLSEVVVAKSSQATEVTW
jgi:hypothetical protein